MFLSLGYGLHGSLMTLVTLLFGTRMLKIPIKYQDIAMIHRWEWGLELFQRVPQSHQSNYEGSY